MLATLLAFPILGGLIILQSAVFSRITLLHGTTDLVLLAIVAWSLQKRVQTAWQWGIIGGLLVSVVSALPLGVPVLCYLLAVVLALMLRQRVWQVPILAMFVTIFFSTFIVHIVTFVALRVIGTPLPVLESVNLITLPSVLLNMLLAIPFYALLGDLAHWIYPEELEM
jgi:rod shape-determining protein MreD